MNDELTRLVTNAKSNPDAFWPLVDALRLAVSHDPSLLVTYARAPSKIERVVRRYRLGPSTLVRDQRTGRSTGRLDQVLEGHLDMFLLPPAGG